MSLKGWLNAFNRADSIILLVNKLKKYTKWAENVWKLCRLKKQTVDLQTMDACSM